MKRRKYNKHGMQKSGLTLMLLAIISTGAFSQYSTSREIRKTFASTTSTVLDIENKYGDITIETWEQDSVSVEIKVEVSDKTRSKARDKMDDIGIKTTQSGNYVMFGVVMGETKSLFMSELSKLKENVGLDDASIQIDMVIKAPDNLELRIKNKFGNVYLQDYSGEIRLEMSNGKLKANDLSGYCSLKVSFGDAIINSIDSGSLEIYYGELHLGKARKLRVTSKTSDVSIIEVSQFLVNSRQDDYTIRMIDEMQCESSWTDFSISELNRLTNVKMNHGEITVEKLNPDFENIIIDSKSTKINLYLAPETSVNFEITTNKDLSLPMDANIDIKKEIDKDQKIFKLTGNTGKKTDDDPRIVIKSISGEINIIKR